MIHSDFGPSSLDKRYRCPGSYFMEKDLPALPGNEAAGRGTELHAEVARIIEAELKGEDVNIDTSLFDPNEIEAIRFCYEAYKAVYYEPMIKWQVLTEKTWDYSNTIPEIGVGTSDLVIYESYNRVHVFEWKFNYIDVEDAENNLQAAAYAIPAFDEYEARQVTVHVVEAFKRNHSTFVYIPEEIKGVKEFINHVIKACNMKFAPLRPFKKTCQYCKALLNCPAILAGMNDTEVINPLSNLPGDEISKLLDAAAINAFVAGKIKEYAYALMMSGVKVKDYFLSEGRRKREFKKDVTKELLEAIADKIDRPKKYIVKTELVTVQEIEKIWGKAKVVRDAIEPLIDEKRGNPILTRTMKEA